jgi:hypothetical protein
MSRKYPRYKFNAEDIIEPIDLGPIDFKCDSEYIFYICSVFVFVFLCFEEMQMCVTTTNYYNFL